LKVAIQTFLAKIWYIQLVDMLLELPKSYQSEHFTIRLWYDYLLKVSIDVLSCDTGSK